MAYTQAIGKFSQQFSDEVHSRVFKQMRQYGIIIQNKARELAPVRSGKLRDSIHYFADESNYSLTITVGASYGLFVEFGTRHMRPQPYLRPAINMIPVTGLYGIETAMSFHETPRIHAPIIAAGKGFHLPSTLTHSQLTHVRQHLKPESKKQWEHKSGHVSRTKLHVRHR